MGCEYEASERVVEVGTRPPIHYGRWLNSTAPRV